MSAAAEALTAPDGDDRRAGAVRGGSSHRPPLHLAPDGVGPADGPPPRADDPHRGPATSRSGIRVRVAPRSEEPADRLPAAFAIPAAPPVLGSSEALARRPAADARPRADLAAADAAGAADAALPDPTQLCCAMVQAAVEGLRGARPLAQLVRWVSPEVYEQLTLRAELVVRAAVPTPTGRAGIRRVRVCRIGPRAAEAAVIVDDGPRVRAVALRLEAHRGRWRATALEIG